MHVRQRKRGRIVVVKDAQPNDPQDFSFTAGGGLSPSALPARRRRECHAVEHPDVQRRRAGRPTESSEQATAGWVQDSATCDDGSSPASIVGRAGRDGDVHIHEQPQGPASSRSRTPSPTTRRTSPSPPAAACRRPASSSTTTRTRRCRTRAPSRPSIRAPATRSTETVPSGWDQTAATCDDGSPLANISSPRVRPSPAPSRTASGDRSSRSRTRSPTTRRTSPSRRAAACRRPASSSTTTPTRPCRTRSTFANVVPGSRLLAGARRCRRLGAVSAHPAATAARSATSTWPPARRSRAPSRTFAATRARRLRRRRTSRSCTPTTHAPRRTEVTRRRSASRPATRRY